MNISCIFPCSHHNLSFLTAEAISNPFYRIQLLKYFKRAIMLYLWLFSPSRLNIPRNFTHFFLKVFLLILCCPAHPPSLSLSSSLLMPFLIGNQDWGKGRICRSRNTTAFTALGIFNRGNPKWGWESVVSGMRTLPHSVTTANG